MTLRVHLKASHESYHNGSIVCVREYDAVTRSKVYK